MGKFLKFHSNRIVSCSLYDNYESFPIGQKLAKIELDDNTFKYLLLDKFKAPFDSGLRYEEDSQIYQIDTSYVYNIFDSKFAFNNYYVNFKDIVYATFALSSIFDSRVTRDGEDIILISPRKDLGITKLLLIGLNISISYVDKIDDGVESSFEFSTFMNGTCNCKSKTLDRFKMKAMLVKLDPERSYKIHFENSYRNISYNEDIRNCIFFGEDIENLPETSSSYHKLLHITNFFTTNPFTLSFDSANDFQSYTYKDIMLMKDQYARYSNNSYVYNYFNLNDIVSFS